MPASVLNVKTGTVLVVFYKTQLTTSLAREHQRQIEGSSEKTATARNPQILQFSPHSTTIKTMMLNKREISHPQAINRSCFCRESFKQSQSVS
jgi:hypothetical protein